MTIVCCSVMLGFIQVSEYSAENAKVKKFLSYAKIAVIFIVIGYNLSKAGF